MQQIIDPKEVPQMFLEGRLWHGIMLEFRNDTSAWWVCRVQLLGFDPNKCMYLTRDGWYEQARFPLPELKIDDPVIVSMGLSKLEHKRYFKEFDSKGNIVCFDDGATSWSSTRSHAWDNWRLPTPDELPK